MMQAGIPQVEEILLGQLFQALPQEWFLESIHPWLP
jgi:hypothetical protein